eukprot:31483-Pelagococcus_subviridis.AAC.21
MRYRRTDSFALRDDGAPRARRQLDVAPLEQRPRLADLPRRAVQGLVRKHPQRLLEHARHRRRRAPRVALQNLVHLPPPSLRVGLSEKQILQRVHQMPNRRHRVPVLRRAVPRPRRVRVRRVRLQQRASTDARIARLPEHRGVRAREETPRIRVRAAADHRSDEPTAPHRRPLATRDRDRLLERVDPAVDRERDVRKVPRERVHPLVPKRRHRSVLRGGEAAEGRSIRANVGVESKGVSWR